MDIYGKLNNETVKKEYVGSTTDTAKVKVDNQSNTISAEVHKVPNKLKIDYWDKENGYVDIEYDGSEEVSVHIPQISDVNQLLSRMDDAEQDIDNLQSDVTDLKDKDTTIENDLTQEIINRQEADRSIENNAKNINIQDNSDGTFTFTNYENQETVIQSGYPADEDTIQVENNKLTLKKVYVNSDTLEGKGTENEPLNAVGIKDSTGIITPEDVRLIDSKIRIASKQQMGMVYGWVDSDNHAHISLNNPNDVIVNTSTAPNGSLEYEINTYNYISNILSDGSIEYIIGD